MEATRMLLIRHGETQGNSRSEPLMSGWADLPLSTAGCLQAERLRDRVKGDSATALYSSPLGRAVETARIVQEELHLPMIFLDDLREIYCGAFEGTPVRIVEKEHPDLWKENLGQANDQFRWPGGESYAEFRTRALEAMAHIHAKHAGERVVVVTHTGLISQVLGFLHGLSAARWSNYRPGNASVTEIDWDGQSGKLVIFDDRIHLDRTALPS